MKHDILARLTALEGKGVVRRLGERKGMPVFVDAQDGWEVSSLPDVVLLELEARGLVCRTGAVRDGQSVFVAAEFVKRH